MTRLKGGLYLSLAAAVVGTLLAGWRGTLAAGAFGLLATAIQALAGRKMRTGPEATTREFMMGYASGTGLRILGVVLLGIVIWLDLAMFPPIPAAMGFLGVLVPLLFFEARQV